LPKLGVRERETIRRNRKSLEDGNLKAYTFCLS
jgi:hypothetical protein